MSVLSRTTRGIGYGAVSISVLGYAAVTSYTAGHRSMLAPWLGGASAVPAVVASGRRSMLAFWMGGAGGYEAVIPPETPIEESHQFFANFDRSLIDNVDRVLRRKKEEEEIVMIIAAAVTKRLLH